MRRFININGNEFGRWTVLKFDCVKNGVAYWMCKCDCERIKSVSGSSLRCGGSMSCGCLSKEIRSKRLYKHGMCGTRFYDIWRGMNRRCIDPKTNYYHRYGGRGVKVCNRWKDFRNFRDDMYKSYLIKFEDDSNCQIDRKDNNGNYELSNCEWSSPKENSNNKDSRKLKQRKLTDGQVKEIRNAFNKKISMTKIAKENDVSRTIISYIINNKTYKDVI